MSATESSMYALERNWEMVDEALAELDETTMANCINDQSNSISWLLWHMSRVVDRLIHMRFQETEQAWVKDGWHQKFNMAADPQEFGRGWSSDQVATWRPPSKDILVGYYEQMKSATRIYLTLLTAQDLERQLPFPTPPDMLSMGEAIGVLVFDNIVHGGQIAYLRGYYRGMGWYP